MAVVPGGKPAITHYRPKKRFAAHTLLECDLETGRTHQIRVHLAHVGHPILGDDKYGDFDLNKALEKDGHKRMFLHAFQVIFLHPADVKREVRIEASVPKAFAAFQRTCDAPV